MSNILRGGLLSNRIVSVLTLTLVVLLLCNYGIGNVENIKTQLKANGTSQGFSSEKNIQQREKKNTEVPNYKILLSLTDHGPIEISSDADFSAFPGSGAAGDPYIIEGYNITTTANYGIYIHNTTKYFIIRNCYINAVERGIYISNVAHGTAKIINNTVTDNWNDDIYLSSSGSFTVANNTVTDNWNDGIYLSSSGSSTVANNTVTNNGHEGIALYDSGSSTVANNTFVNNGLNILSSNFLDDYLTLTIEDNLVNGKPLSYLVNLADTVIDQPNYYG